MQTYSPGANKLLSTHAVRAVAEPFCLAPTDGGSSARDAVAAVPYVSICARRVIEPYALQQTTCVSIIAHFHQDSVCCIVVVCGDAFFNVISIGRNARRRCLQINELSRGFVVINRAMYVVWSVGKSCGRSVGHFPLRRVQRRLNFEQEVDGNCVGD